ncbi:MAG: chloride channel protein, partial [Ignavibacteriaceae bacterium]
MSDLNLWEVSHRKGMEVEKFLLPGFLKPRYTEQKDHVMSYGQTLLWAVIIGLGGGFIATAYYLFLKGGLYFVWDILKPALATIFSFSIGNVLTVIFITSLGGLLVGLSAKYLSATGEISAVVNNIHLKHGRMDYKQNPSMLINSLISITFGGSAGPEAPLVQL